MWLLNLQQLIIFASDLDCLLQIYNSDVLARTVLLADLDNFCFVQIFLRSKDLSRQVYYKGIKVFICPVFVDRNTLMSKQWCF